MRLALRMSCGVCALAATLAWGAPSAEQVMDDYLAHYGKVVYAASELLQERQTDGERAQVVNLVRQKPGRDYSRFLYGSPAHKGIVTADDGGRTVIYVPNESRVYEYRSGAAKAQERRRTELQRLREKFDVIYVASETVAERACHHIQLKPKEGRGPTVDVWIDAQRFVALRQEVKSGDRIWRSSRFKSVDYDVALGDADFRFTPPAGTTRIAMDAHPTGPKNEGYDYSTATDVRRKAGFRIMEPSYVPAGFRRQAYQVGAPRPGALFHRRLSVRYLSGNRMLMLNQGIAGPIRRGPGGDEPGRPTQMKPGVYFWTKHEIRLLLIGPREHDADDLRKCAESVDWYDAGGKDGERHAGCGAARPELDRLYPEGGDGPPPRFADYGWREQGERSQPAWGAPPLPHILCAQPDSGGDSAESQPSPAPQRPTSPRELEEAVLARW